jgi:adenosylcobinamide kinase / adenosylcobinamide-phosphate guanylyltransferase
VSLVVLIGGARSGKSREAIRRATVADRPAALIATAEVRDEEMAERIARHRAERPAGWIILEEPAELRSAIGRVPADAPLVVDCLSLWVANMLERGWTDEQVELEAIAAAAEAAARAAPSIAVSNEVGLGVVPVSELGRRYRDVLGRVNAAWADAADETFLVVAGRLLRLERARG